MTRSPEDLRLLRLQLALAGLGAVVWYGGVFASSDFVSGVGVGILIAALSVRLLKRRS